ncbi:S8 family serine peptidase [Robbsia sp. KACC 23696]|uniref:S8 family serine peptidase n=1 Tax=Robbsia sp. KACC 23696 TaxID=3149231 RepID=UPI00325BBF18
MIETVYFGTKHEAPLVLRRSAHLLVVRMHPDPVWQSARSTTPNVSAAGVDPRWDDARFHHAASLQDCTEVVRFANAGVGVFSVPAAGLPVEDRLDDLRRAADVRFAGAGWVEDSSDSPIVYTGNAYVRFAEDVTPAQCLDRIAAAGLRIKRRVEYATNAYFVAVPEEDGRRVFDASNALRAEGGIAFCHPEILFPMQAYGIHRNQWHLQRSAVTYARPVSPDIVYPAIVDAHANVAEAHTLSTGKGAVVAIIDDAIDIDHPEFRQKVVSPRSYTGPYQVDENPRPRLSAEFHGTCVAGVAVASGRFGASGVAPDAWLMPIRLMLQQASAEVIAQAIYWAASRGADVINVSLGPDLGEWNNADDPRRGIWWPMAAYVRDALTYATTQGRNGKGCAVVYAAGNSNNNVARIGHASHPGILVVGACNEHGRRSAYSNHGAALSCCFPSNDFRIAGRPALRTHGIRTTSAQWQRAPRQSGDSEMGDYTEMFGGTSAAAPGVAGVLALMVAANPDLTQSELSRCLVGTCERIGDPSLEGPAAEYDEGGHSVLYGHGRVNAFEAVRAARDWPDADRHAGAAVFSDADV